MTTDPTPPRISTKRRIKRFDPIQLGKMLAALYGILGLIVIPFFLLLTWVGAVAGTHRSGTAGMGLPVKFSGFFCLLFPVLYAAMGFVGGAVGALIYNVLAKWIGGIEVEVE